MTDTEVNIAIAKACGWTLFEHDGGLWSGLHNGTYINYKCGISKEHAEKVCFPNYHGDLNAMHEAEKVIAEMVHATARQRAEAFLRTIGKWKEEAK